MSTHPQIRDLRGSCLLLACAVLVLSGSASAQTTAFTYQGKLNDNGNPASGPYDFQFKLFNTAPVGTGTQQGSTIDVPNVSVTAGVFTVQLDFGAAVFPGAERYLEISIRPVGGGVFTMLAPRQAVTATPYALRSTTAGVADTATNATQLGGLTADGFIQNTTSQQAATSFNIGGTGTANVLNAATQFNLSEIGNRHSAIEEWFVNSNRVIEHGCDIAAPPGEGKEGDPLRLRLAVSGDLTASVDAMGRGAAR